MKSQLRPVLALPQLKRACFDARSNGEQLCEEARQEFGWKVEGIKFTHATKEQAAFALKNDFEDCRLRIVSDDALRADLRALKKQSSKSGNITLEGRTEDSHCDRTWAKALRQHAATIRNEIGISVG
jgi:phage FluMu gp28-like protein